MNVTLDQTTTAKFTKKLLKTKYFIHRHHFIAVMVFDFVTNAIYFSKNC